MELRLSVFLSRIYVFPSIEKNDIISLSINKLTKDGDMLSMDTLLKKFNNKKRGYTLIETVLVICILGVIISAVNGLFSMYAQNLNSKGKINNQMQQENNIQMMKRVLAESKLLTINNNSVIVNSTYFNSSGETYTLSCESNTLTGQRNGISKNVLANNIESCSIKTFDKYQNETLLTDKAVGIKVIFKENGKVNQSYAKLK